MQKYRHLTHGTNLGTMEGGRRLYVLNIKLLVLKILSGVQSFAVTHLLVTLVTLLVSLPGYALDDSNEINIDTSETETISVATDHGQNEVEVCRSHLVNQDLEDRYENIQEKLEKDFNQGLPKQLRSDLIEVRKQVDALSVKAFDLNDDSSQEINQITQQTIDSLERIIGLLPKASALAPQVREQYVVPFTNISSIRAERQDCLMKVAIADAKAEIEDKKEVSSGNIYKKLTSELNELNQNLYKLETTDVQKFIGLRTTLLNRLEQYNKKPKQNSKLSQNIPEVLNSLQSEIEKVLPGLELSKKYYSIAH